MASRYPDERVTVPILTTACWSAQTFLHWPLPPDTVRAVLPSGLVPDTFAGRAWVSFTPFVMEGIRPGGLLRLPGLSTCPETNLRTYVRGPDGRDGVWFFALEVTNALLMAAARAGVGLPYRMASARVREDSPGAVRYEGRRWGGGPSYRLRVRPGPPLGVSDLDIWLTGRWRAWTRHGGRLLHIPLEHQPWRLRAATVEHLSQDLTTAAGLPGGAALPRPLAHYSDGVSGVRFGPPRLPQPGAVPVG